MFSASYIYVIFIDEIPTFDPSSRVNVSMVRLQEPIRRCVFFECMAYTQGYQLLKKFIVKMLHKARLRILLVKGAYEIDMYLASRYRKEYELGVSA